MCDHSMPPGTKQCFDSILGRQVSGPTRSYLYRPISARAHMPCQHRYQIAVGEPHAPARVALAPMSTAQHRRSRRDWACTVQAVEALGRHLAPLRPGCVCCELSQCITRLTGSPHTQDALGGSGHMTVILCGPKGLSLGGVDLSFFGAGLKALGSGLFTKRLTSRPCGSDVVGRVGDECLQRLVLGWGETPTPPSSPVCSASCAGHVANGICNSYSWCGKLVGGSFTDFIGLEISNLNFSRQTCQRYTSSSTTERFIMFEAVKTVLYASPYMLTLWPENASCGIAGSKYLPSKFVSTP